MKYLGFIGLIIALIFLLFLFYMSRQAPPKTYPAVLTEQYDPPLYRRILGQVKSSTVLDIRNCNTEPRIIGVKNHSEFTIKNTGPVSHYITINKKDYFIAAGKQIKTSLSVPETPTIYTVACDVPGALGGGGILVVQ